MVEERDDIIASLAPRILLLWGLIPAARAPSALDFLFNVTTYSCTNFRRRVWDSNTPYQKHLEPASPLTANCEELTRLTESGSLDSLLPTTTAHHDTAPIASHHVLGPNLDPTLIQTIIPRSPLQYPHKLTLETQPASSWQPTEKAPHARSPAGPSSNSATPAAPADRATNEGDLRLLPHALMSAYLSSRVAENPLEAQRHVSLETDQSQRHSQPPITFLKENQNLFTGSERVRIMKGGPLKSVLW